MHKIIAKTITTITLTLELFFWGPSVLLDCFEFVSEDISVAEVSVYRVSSDVELFNWESSTVGSSCVTVSTSFSSSTCFSVSSTFWIFSALSADTVSLISSLFSDSNFSSFCVVSSTFSIFSDSFLSISYSFHQNVYFLFFSKDIIQYQKSYLLRWRKNLKDTN